MGTEWQQNLLLLNVSMSLFRITITIFTNDMLKNTLNPYNTHQSSAEFEINSISARICIRKSVILQVAWLLFFKNRGHRMFFDCKNPPPFFLLKIGQKNNEVVRRRRRLWRDKHGFTSLCEAQLHSKGNSLFFASSLNYRSALLFKSLYNVWHLTRTSRKA